MGWLTDLGNFLINAIVIIGGIAGIIILIGIAILVFLGILYWTFSEIRRRAPWILLISSVVGAIYGFYKEKTLSATFAGIVLGFIFALFLVIIAWYATARRSSREV